jgi:acyl-coenzyme A synthetase/AMP-(fatty) acid ligase
VAYLQLADGHYVEDVEDELATRLASYKRPQVWHALPELPRTTTGKLVRDRSVLRAAVQ